MRIMRRRWLTAAAGTTASGFIPFAGRAAATAATLQAPGRDAAHVPAATLRLCFGAEVGAAALREAIRIAAARCAVATIDEVELPALGSREAPRLDALVGQLRRLRGEVLLGAVCAHHTVSFDEALRELGAAWMLRGEHAALAAGPSRHRLAIARAAPGQGEVLYLGGWNHSPAREWQAILGAGMAIHALMPHVCAADLPLIDLKTHPPPAREAQGTTSASTCSDSFLTFVTRI